MLGLLIVLGVLFLVFEGTTHSVYGNFLSDELVDAYIEEFEPFEFNPFDDDIVSPKMKFDDDYDIERMLHVANNGRFISKTKISFLSRYYINKLGRIPIWSTSHKKVRDLYKKLKQEQC